MQTDWEYFKSSHCNSLNGQFHKFRGLPNGEGKKRADSVRDDLDQILRQSKLMTLGAVLPIPFFHKMQAAPEKFGVVPAVPYQMAFQQVLAECAAAMKEIGRNSSDTMAGTIFQCCTPFMKSLRK